MRVLEGVFLWVTISLYVVSLLLFLWRAVFKNERQELYAWKCWLIGFCTHSATILVRWIESGHPPVLWPYEHGLLSTWFIALIFILAGRWVPGLKILGIVVSPAVLMILGYGIMNQGIGIEPLPPPYRSNWLWVHVTFAWLAYGAFAFTAVVALLYIIRHMAPRFTGKAVLKWLPSPEVLDDLIFRVIIFGFAGLTIEMGAGALWAYGLWGRYWAWDPMETWTLTSWVVYALYLHLSVTMGWRGIRMAWLAIIAFCFILIAFGGIAMMSGLHGTLI